MSSCTCCIPEPDKADTDENARFPEPSVFNTVSAEPSAVGKLSPSKIIFPDPLGVIDMFPLDAETIEFPFTSNYPLAVGLSH